MEKTKELKGFKWFLGAVVRQFSVGMVCFIALEESFGSTLYPRPRAQTTFFSLCKC